MNSKKNIKVTFCSGAGTVTGANFLIEGEGKKFLVDCGLIQGEKFVDDLNWKKFPYEASEIDILFITHGHIDHIGRIPKLINEGFKGKIISTSPTRGITEIMLADTSHILSRDKDNGLDKIYTEANNKKAINMWSTLDYGEKLTEGLFQFSFKDAGHILGSGMLEILYNGKKIMFTGDLGNSPSPLLPDTENISDVDYLIMESVYGDRNHEGRNERKKILEKIIKDNYKRNGTLMIPTFSLERTQELLYEVNDLVENKKVPPMPIYLDSPLAIRLTKVYLKYEKYFNKKAKDIIASGDDLFDFPGLKMTMETEESKAILRVPNPKIVIAGSGMSNGGRIIHHEKNYLPSKNNTLLLTGYQAFGTLGRSILNGVKRIKILGSEIDIKAKIEVIFGYSGHKDSDHLVEFVEGSEDSLREVYVVMGEPKSSMHLAQKLRDNLGVSAISPDAGDVAILEC